MQLSPKEKMLLEDLKSHEQMFVQKCTDYANQTSDPQLKQLFQSIAQRKQQHLQTIGQNLNQTQGYASAGQTDQKDAMLCQDVLSTQKYLSGFYNTAIFEMQDTKIRQDLNVIQSDTQKQGEEVFQFMQSKGIYNVH
jgi:spore coat protein CotF